MPLLLRRLRARGLTVEDRYKPGSPTIVTHAGVLILGLSILSFFGLFVVDPGRVALLAFPPQAIDPANVLRDRPFLADEIALLTACGYGVVGALDDRHALSQVVKASVPLTLGLSCVALLSIPNRGALPSVFYLGPFSLFGVPLLIWIAVPLYILVVSNLVNLHSGFNGLQSGLSLILLGTLAIRLYVSGQLDQNLFLLVVLGATAAFYPFNRYPAKAIEGNVGSFLVGSAIGIGIVTNGLFVAGLVMLAPHIADFLLFLYGKVTGHPFIKFGTLRPDGTIQPPYPYKLKFLITTWFRLPERSAVRWLWAMTLVSCLLSFAIPGQVTP